MAGRYRLTWTSRRSTPIVTPKGKRRRPLRQGEGKVVKTRYSSSAEERKMRGGKWLRVDAKGRTPSDPKYKTTAYRPGPRKQRLAAKARRK